jgi:hypothetical protein
MLYDLIPTMPEHRLVPLAEKFAEAAAKTSLIRPYSCKSGMRG